MTKQSSLTEAIAKHLPDLAGKQCYFHDEDNKEELSGIYTIAPPPQQDPSTETILLIRENQQAWANPGQLQLNTPGRNIKDVERMVLELEDGSLQFKSGDVARIMLAITNANPKYTEEMATGRAMELMQGYRLNGYILNDGRKLMTYDYWEKNYA